MMLIEYHNSKKGNGRNNGKGGLEKKSLVKLAIDAYINTPAKYFGVLTQIQKEGLEQKDFEIRCIVNLWRPVRGLGKSGLTGRLLIEERCANWMQISYGIYLTSLSAGPPEPFTL
jgi:hypothetical protein